MKYFTKVAGYFENLHGFKSEEALKQYSQTKKQRRDYETSLRKAIAAKAPSKQVLHPLSGKKMNVPDVNWEKVKPELKKKVNKKYPLKNPGKDFGYLAKYEAISPVAYYEKHPLTGKKQKKKFVTKEYLKKVNDAKEYDWLDKKSKKIIEKALNSDYKVFAATDVY